MVTDIMGILRRTRPFCPFPRGAGRSRSSAIIAYYRSNRSRFTPNAHHPAKTVNLGRVAFHPLGAIGYCREALIESAVCDAPMCLLGRSEIPAGVMSCAVRSWQSGPMGIGAVRQSNMLDAKSEVKSSALVDDTLDVDSPSHFIHDFLRGGQPNPRSPVSLARFEGVKDSLERIRFYAFAVVVDGDFDESFVGIVPGSDVDSPILGWRRIDCV